MSETVASGSGGQLTQLVAVLAAEGMAADEVQVAEALWLAAQIRRASGPPQAADVSVPRGDVPTTESPQRATGESGHAPQSATGTGTGAAPVDAGSRPEAAEDREDGAEAAAPSPSGGRQAEVTAAAPAAGGGEEDALPFKVTTADPLPGRLRLLQAMRPLGRSVPARSARVIDVEATIAQAAEQFRSTGRRSLPPPVLRPDLVRALSAVLVVDGSPSVLSIWRDTADAWAKMLSGSGLFRRVRAFSLEPAPLPPSGGGRAGRTALRPLHARRGHPPEGSPTPGTDAGSRPQGINDPAGRQVIFFLSDGTGPQWRDGTFVGTLHEWSRANVVVLVQVLPHQLWAGTAPAALGRPASLRALRVPRNNGDLSVLMQRRVPGVTDATTALHLPVLAPHPSHLAALSDVLMGRQRAALQGYVLPVAGPALRAGSDADEEEDEEEDDAGHVPTAEERVTAFRSWASADARRLAAYLAHLEGFSLDVMRLVQSLMLGPDAAVSVAAEVYLSGLLRAASSPHEGRPGTTVYAFPADVAALLRDTLPAAEALNLQIQLSRYVAERKGQPDYFLAFLRGDAAAARHLQGAPAFARIAAETLERLGGRYAALAMRLRGQPGPPEPAPAPAMLVKPAGQAFAVDDRFYRFAWSPDGRRIIAPTHGGKLLAYDTGDLLGGAAASPSRAVALTEDGALNQVSFSHDGTRLAAGGFGGGSWVWNLPYTDGTVHRKQPFGHHQSDVKAVAWSPGLALYTGTQDGRLRRLVILRPTAPYENPESPARFVHEHGSAINCLAWAPHRQTSGHHTWLAFGCDDGAVGFVRGEREDAPLTMCHGHAGPAWSMAWSPDGSLLATGGGRGAGGEVCLWDFTERERPEPPGAPVRRVMASSTHEAIVGLSFDPSGRILASKEEDGTVRLWRAADLSALGSFSEEDQRGHLFATLAFHPRLPLLASAGGNDVPLRLYEVDVEGLLRQKPARVRPRVYVSLSGCTEAVRDRVREEGASADHVEWVWGELLAPDGRAAALQACDYYVGMIGLTAEDGGAAELRDAFDRGEVATVRRAAERLLPDTVAARQSGKDSLVYFIVEGIDVSARRDLLTGPTLYHWGGLQQERPLRDLGERLARAPVREAPWLPTVEEANSDAFAELEVSLGRGGQHRDGVGRLLRELNRATLLSLREAFDVLDGDGVPAPWSWPVVRPRDERLLLDYLLPRFGPEPQPVVAALRAALKAGMRCAAALRPAPDAVADLKAFLVGLAWVHDVAGAEAYEQVPGLRRSALAPVAFRRWLGLLQGPAIGELSSLVIRLTLPGRRGYFGRLDGVTIYTDVDDLGERAFRSIELRRHLSAARLRPERLAFSFDGTIWEARVVTRPAPATDDEQIQLTEERRVQLCAVLAGALEGRDEWEALFGRHLLGASKAALPSHGSGGEWDAAVVATRAVEWARREGRLTELIEVAAEENPDDRLTEMSEGIASWTGSLPRWPPPEIPAGLRPPAVLPDNVGIAFYGVSTGGDFTLDDVAARRMLMASNASGRPNSDVVRRFVTGADIAAGYGADRWVIDFARLSDEEAAGYEEPFEHVYMHVRPGRDTSGSVNERVNWWQHHRTSAALRRAQEGRSRLLVTPTVSKHRVFTWVPADAVPASSCIAFVRDDEYFFGVLQSRAHAVWSLALGSRLYETVRYGVNTFLTFPLPFPAGQEPRESPTVNQIADAARGLSERRESWLASPTAADGGGARRRSLTALYNASPEWLTDAHRRLDAAVAAAYGWTADLADGDLLARLLELNASRAEAGPIRGRTEPHVYATRAELRSLAAEYDAVQQRPASPATEGDALEGIVTRMRDAARRALRADGTQEE